MKSFSTSWKASKQPRKQRKYLKKAPLHLKQKQMSAHLSKALRENHKVRSIQLRKGDGIKVMRGQFKGKTGKIERIDLKRHKLYITGIEVLKRDGSKALVALTPSNMLVDSINLDDKKRKKQLERLVKND